MIEHRCKNCLWWDSKHRSVNLVSIELGKIAPGFCRKHKPGGYRIGSTYYGVQPVMDADEFCGEFRPDREA